MLVDLIEYGVLAEGLGYLAAVGVVGLLEVDGQPDLLDAVGYRDGYVLVELSFSTRASIRRL